MGLSDHLYTLLAFKPNSGAMVFLFWGAILEADGPEELGFDRGVLLSAFGTTIFTSLSLSSGSAYVCLEAVVRRGLPDLEYAVQGMGCEMCELGEIAQCSYLMQYRCYPLSHKLSGIFYLAAFLDISLVHCSSVCTISLQTQCSRGRLSPSVG